MSSSPLVACTSPPRATTPIIAASPPEKGSIVASTPPSTRRPPRHRDSTTPHPHPHCLFHFPRPLIYRFDESYSYNHLCSFLPTALPRPVLSRPPVEKRPTILVSFQLARRGRVRTSPPASLPLCLYLSSETPSIHRFKPYTQPSIRTTLRRHATPIFRAPKGPHRPICHLDRRHPSKRNPSTSYPQQSSPAPAPAPNPSKPAVGPRKTEKKLFTIPILGDIGPAGVAAGTTSNPKGPRVSPSVDVG